MNKITFKADKYSGLQGVIFATSVILDAVRQNDIRHKFKFGFYGLSFNTETEKADEWVDNEKYQELSGEIIDYINRGGLDYFKETRVITTREALEIEKQAHETLPEISSFSDFQLIQEYIRFVDFYCHRFGFGAVTFPYEGILSDWLFQSLSKRYNNASEILSSELRFPYRSFMVEAENFLLQIKIENDSQKKDKLIDQFLTEFFFIKSGYSYSDILDRKTIVSMAEDAKGNQALSGNEENTVSDLTEEEKNIVKLFEETEIIRDQRKKTNLIGSYVMFRFLEDLCRRTKVDVNLAKRMFWFEFGDLFSRTSELVEELKGRKTASVVLDNKNLYYLDYNAIVPRKLIDKGAKEFRGTSASRGRIKAPAKIIFGPKDFGKFKKGEVLVTEMTRPDFLPVMKKASAIVTDEGGLTCHAAIVARELGIPCVIGTKIATEILKDGDLIEVDAGEGIVRAVQKDEYF